MSEKSSRDFGGHAPFRSHSGSDCFGLKPVLAPASTSPSPSHASTARHPDTHTLSLFAVLGSAPPCTRAADPLSPLSPYSPLTPLHKRAALARAIPHTPTPRQHTNERAHILKASTYQPRKKKEKSVVHQSTMQSIAMHLIASKPVFKTCIILCASPLCGRPSNQHLVQR